MNSKIKGLIVVGIAFVLLIAAVLVLSLSGKPDGTDSSSIAQTQAKLIYEKKPEDVSAISIKNQNGGIELTKKGDTYAVDGLESLPVNSESMNLLLDSVAKISVKKTIEESAADLGKYGLTTPSVSVKVTFSDSSTTVKEFMLGDKSTTANQTYFAFKGEKIVYAVDTAAFAPLTSSKLGLLDTTIVPMPAAGEDGAVVYPVVDSISVVRGDVPYTTTLIYDKFLADPSVDAKGKNDTTHVMTAPIKADLDFEKATPYIRGLFGLSGAAVIAHPTPDELAKSGITKDSLAVVSAVIEGKTYNFIIGNSVPAEDDFAEGFLCYYDGLDILIRVDKTALPWVTVDSIGIVSSLIFLPNIYEVGKIDIATASGNTSFALTGKDDTFAVTMDGKTMTAEYFKKFYQFLLTAPPDEFHLEAPAANTPDVKLTYTLRSGDVHTLEFFNDAARRSIIVFDGVVSYKCRTSYVERLLSNMGQLAAEGEIVDNF